MSTPDTSSGAGLLDWAESIICNAVPMSHCTQEAWDKLVVKWRDAKHEAFPLSIKNELPVIEGEEWEVRFDNMIYCTGGGDFVTLIRDERSRNEVVRIHNASLERVKKAFEE